MTAQEAPIIRQRTRPQPQPQPPRRLDLSDAEGTIEVSRGIYSRGQPVREDPGTLERIRVPIFHTAPARVRVESSVTRNLGDYNSVRVAVAIDMPCYPEETEVNRVYDMVSGWLDVIVPTELARAVAGDEQGS